MNDIRTIRKRAGLTQGELARRMKVHQATVSRWERGELTPNSRDVMAAELAVQEGAAGQQPEAA